MGAALFAGLADPVALFLALILASAAGHKLASPDRLAAATGNLTGLASPLARPALFAAAALEAASALALILPATRPLGALLAAAIWAVYAVALARAKSRGASLMDCGCSFSSHKQGIGRFDLMRSVVLIALAASVALLSGPASGLSVEAVFAALAFFSFYLAAGELAAIPSTIRSIAR